MAKTKSKPNKSDETDDETTSAMVMSMLGDGLEGLRRHITIASEDIRDSEQAADLAHLLTKVAMVAGELRKSENAARKADGDLTPQLMLERIRRMSQAERQVFLRAAQHADADQGKSGLA